MRFENFVFVMINSLISTLKAQLYMYISGLPGSCTAAAPPRSLPRHFAFSSRNRHLPRSAWSSRFSSSLCFNFSSSFLNCRSNSWWSLWEAANSSSKLASRVLKKSSVAVPVCNTVLRHFKTDLIVCDWFKESYIFVKCNKRRWKTRTKVYYAPDQN